MSSNFFFVSAHVAGISGEHLNGDLGKIVGIDPAGPLFDSDVPNGRLSSSSAKYSECIHSGYPYGILKPICQTDFYVNKGFDQPNCGTIFEDLCSHARGVEIYSEALENPKAFFGYRCENLDQTLNENCSDTNGAFINGESKSVGIFHVKTNDQSPFGRG